MVMRKCIYAWCFFLLISIPVYADSPVWKVSKGEHYIYLAGTVHLLGKADYPLPSTFEQAYKDSEKLVFETDIEEFQTPAFQKIFMEKLTFPEGKTIQNVISKNTFAALKKHLSDRGVPVEQLIKFKPGMLTMVLSVLEMQRLKIADAGVDDFYLQKGMKDHKKLGYLESVNEQLSFIIDMDKGNPDELIMYTLRDISQIEEQMAVIKQAWRKGDNAKLRDMVLIPWKKNFPELYNNLLVNRNNKWIPQIEAMLSTTEVEFVLFGALHMVGDDGVLEQLKTRGYHIQKL